MPRLRRICVFTGSNRGTRPDYRDSARALAAALVDRGCELVYGGGSVGLMAVLADSVLERGGHVIGVIPEALVAREVGHRGLPDLRIVGSMHERKALMADLADGFIALPGGLGTLEELFEVLTWAQLGMHGKPCGLLNVASYFDPLMAFLETTVQEGFVRAEHRSLLLSDTDPGALLDLFEGYAPGVLEKWIDRDGT